MNNLKLIQRFKKSILSTLTIAILLTACTPKTYYVTAIDTYMQQNLNNYVSYEPVEFTVLDSTNDGSIITKAIGLSNLETAIQRASFLIIDVGEELGDAELIEAGKKYSQTDLTVNNMKAVQNKVLKVGNDCIMRINILQSATQQQLELMAQMEGTLNRINREKLFINDNLSNAGLTFDNFADKYNDRLIIYHKYRANNGLGALVLNEMLFVLSDDKITVESAVNM